MPVSSVIATALCVGFAVWLAALLSRAARRRKAARATYFAQLIPLFDRIVTRVEPNGFERMTGHLGPDAFDLQAIPDTLTFRKLPALWVMVSLPAPMPVAATLDIMARPAGQEPFSHFASLPQSLPCPACLPEGTGVRSDNALHVPPEALVARHAGVFADPKVKELLISPKGLRLVILAEEADRGRYLLFRDAEMGLDPIAAPIVKHLIDALLALKADLLLAAGTVT